MAIARNYHPVPGDTRQVWLDAVERVRVAREALDASGEPAPGSGWSIDGDLVEGYAVHAVPRDHLLAALEHLSTWGHALEPTPSRPSIGAMRPQFTLLRAALEAGAAAHWVLDPPESAQRRSHCAELVSWDLREARSALGDLDPSEKANLDRLLAALDETGPITPRKHRHLVRRSALAIDRTPDDVELLWQVASAGAHGFAWFSGVAYEIAVTAADDGQTQTAYAPRTEPLTAVLRAAVELTVSGVDRYLDLLRTDGEIGLSPPA